MTKDVKIAFNFLLDFKNVNAYKKQEKCYFAPTREE